MSKVHRVAVVGGGLLGTLTAILLANRGFQVSIFDARQELLQGASHFGEAKIHLGYTYGLMKENNIRELVASALDFEKIVENALESPVDWKSIRSANFQYDVEEDSLITPRLFLEHAKKVDHILHSRLGESSFMGLSRQDLLPTACITDRGFQTTEFAIDIVALRDLIITRIKNHPNITVLLKSKVTSIRKLGDTLFEVSGEHAFPESVFNWVINSSWQDLNRIDTFSKAQKRDFTYRTKLYVSATTNLKTRAITKVLGKFGDVVIFQSGRLYAADYGSGLTSYENSVVQNFLEREQVPKELAESHWQAIKDRFVSSIPELSEISGVTTFERTILAEGDTDIDNYDSLLHQRRLSYVSQEGQMISGLATKLTSVPSCARQITELVHD
jgi:hypothetical protein